MRSEIKYGNWNDSFGVGLNEDGTMYTYSSGGTPLPFQEYRGDGAPFACQAERQKLLLGTLDMNGERKIQADDILFGIRKINHSYNDWTGDIFEDYTIDILQGKKEDVYQFFNSQCIICCSECCGCGDW